MKILLLYFTGTYSTLYITTLIKNQLLNKGYEVDVFPLSEKKRVSTSKYDVIGIGYPIHAFNAPKIVEEKIAKYNINNKKYFIYKVSGEPYKYNNASSYKLYKIMKKKDNELLGEYHYLMPYNIMFKTKEEFIKYEMEYNIKYIKYMCDNLLNEKPYKVSLFERFITFIFKIQRLGCKVNSKRYKVDKSKCIRCRKCINSCPTKNIEYRWQKKKIIFNDKCVMCMRCSFTCPTNAISIGLLNKWKVNGQYDFLKINSLENNYDITKEDKKFYKKFKPYFDYIDSLTK